MYNIVVNEKVQIDLFHSIKKFLTHHMKEDTKRFLKVTMPQLMNLYQQMDVGGVYKDLDDMYNHFNKEVGTRPDVTITKKRYQRLVLLLLSYSHGIITFGE
jgi:hypothetical protein